MVITSSSRSYIAPGVGPRRIMRWAIITRMITCSAHILANYVLYRKQRLYKPRACLTGGGCWVGANCQFAPSRGSIRELGGLHRRVNRLVDAVQIGIYRLAANQHCWRVFDRLSFSICLGGSQNFAGQFAVQAFLPLSLIHACD